MGENLIWAEDRLTRFEVARLLGARALQISLGAPILIKTEKIDALEIAKEEFKKRIIPITVKRRLPNGEEIVIKIKDAIENWLKEHEEEI